MSQEEINAQKTNLPKKQYAILGYICFSNKKMTINVYHLYKIHIRKKMSFTTEKDNHICKVGKMKTVPSHISSTYEQTPHSIISNDTIARNKEQQNNRHYTNKYNLVAIISNGNPLSKTKSMETLSSKPQYKSKSMQFKIYADIDSYNIEINEEKPEKIISVIQSMSQTFGGICLDGIKLPESFITENKLKTLIDIPILSIDSQVIPITIAAALLNALHIADKEATDINIIFNGICTTSVATMQIMKRIGIKDENISFYDKNGLKKVKEENLNAFYGIHLITETSELFETIKKSDVYIGLDNASALNEKTLSSMPKNMIVFALATPRSEINCNLIRQKRKDAVIATRDGSMPNNINGELVFPFLFRGMLDTLAMSFTDEMEKATIKTIAQTARKPSPFNSSKNSDSNTAYGIDYFIPKTSDKRLLTEVSKAVAKAAIDCGVARRIITDWEEYEQILLSRIEHEIRFCREIFRTRQGIGIHKNHTPTLPQF